VSAAGPGPGLQRVDATARTHLLPDPRG